MDMLADKEWGPMRESYLESNWCVIESGTWRSGLFQWQIHKLSSKHAPTGKIQPPCPCFTVLPIMMLIQAMEATVSTKLTAVILQYVHNNFPINSQALFLFLSQSYMEWSNDVHRLRYPVVVSYISSEFAVYERPLLTVGWKLNHNEGSRYWSQPLMAKQSAWHQTSVNLLRLVWTKYFSVSHIWMD